jgi:hypothetical protein
VGAAPYPSGRFTLEPHWREDYSALVATAREKWQAVFGRAHALATRGNASQIAPRCFGCDTTYKRAAAYLADVGQVEDWGCGAGYFKRFVPEDRYRGIDLDPSAGCDQVADLATYNSETDGILLRHVLEHDLRWQSILRNAMASFRRRMVLVVFTPFVRETGARGPSASANEFPAEIHFCRGDLVREFRGAAFRLEENIRTDSPFGREHVFYLSKDGPA